MVLNLVGLSGQELPFTSVGVKNDDKGYAFNYVDGQHYLLVSQKELITLDKDRNQKLYNYDWETGIMTSAGKSQDPLLKAYLQYFINGLINNNLSI